MHRVMPNLYVTGKFSLISGNRRVTRKHAPGKKGLKSISHNGQVLPDMIGSGQSPKLLEQMRAVLRTQRYAIRTSRPTVIGSVAT
jgi:hypothetical protein